MEKSPFTEEYAVAINLMRRIRLEKGITQVELADLLGESQSFVSKIERKRRRIDLIEARAICIAIGIPLEEFVTRLEAELSRLPSQTPEPRRRRRQDERR